MKATVLLIQVEGNDADLAPVLDLLRARIAGEFAPPQPPAPPAPPAPSLAGPASPAALPEAPPSRPARGRRPKGRPRRPRRQAEPTPEPKTAEPDPGSSPPPIGRAKRITPGPSTIGTGRRPEPDSSPVGPDAAALRILERELPSVGDRKRVVDLGDLSMRVALREAASTSTRFRLITHGKGVPAEIARVA